ncbi:ABC transporter substrate-binding protein [Streptomyces sp. NBC_01803]|uniref:ABC transporter substrate-binding protein n=1 Tax=Streptomyces sp. NBC_01803 TaxID=2975946 RepID=UPI002DD99E9A|nr:ABC transporter substrate-binding protein [Streptomyces sp. NBC_01803]WSA43145.1 ABC transporter substrate-binding protein [Streptomyces sp. NBC_01803]
MTTRRRPLRSPLVLLTVLAAAATACGSSGGDDGAQPEDGGASFEGRGPITYVQGRDTTGTVQEQIDRWNEAHPDEEVTLVELPEDADAQRQQMIQNAETESDAYTVLSLDVVWTSEFAAHQWIDPLPAEEFPLDEMLAPTVETAKYRDTLYAVPQTSDGGLLYYRTDLLEAAGIAEPPGTWAEMREACDAVLALPEAEGMSCYAGQHEKYEGLTVNFAEAVNSAGGVITDDSGAPDVDTPEAREGLDFLVQAFEDGTIPRDGITFKEEEGRRAFQGGDLVFMRQWPYMYSLASATDGSSEVAGAFAVAPLPGLDGPGSSSLGGHNLALSSFAENKATAIDFMKFFSNEENARTNVEITSVAPAYAALYDDPELTAQYPYLPELKESILNAVPRPRVVEYGQVTSAIQEEAYAALTGDKSTGQALADLQETLLQYTSQ